MIATTQCFFVVFCAIALAVAFPAVSQGARVSPVTIGFYNATFDSQGNLVPAWPWETALQQEIQYYKKCPLGHNGWPVFVYNTFLGPTCNVIDVQIIPGMQHGMGILSYLKYYNYFGDSWALGIARAMADYVVQNALTPPDWKWPSIPRSSGINTDFPITMSSQADLLFGTDATEPDKAAMVAYALVVLSDTLGPQANATYMATALNTARVLVQHMKVGNATYAPWPFRVRASSGIWFQSKSSNVVYALRLFDLFIEKGYSEFNQPRSALWTWLVNYLFPSPIDPKKSLWVGFFEDMVDFDQVDRNSWAPLETARYLIESRGKPYGDPQWAAHASQLISFAMQLFSKSRPGNVTVMGEQDNDHNAWGGANSRLGAVAAIFACAGGPSYFKQMALNNLSWMTYFIRQDGCPAPFSDFGSRSNVCGGWQQDANTDVLHNMIDAINALQHGRC